MALVGAAFRLPGGETGKFWERLVSGEDLVTEVEDRRWAKQTFYNPRKSEPGTSYTFAAGSVPNATAFDAAFFGISPREALQMDPQQRLLMELAWEALEDAGVKASILKGTAAGVFMGISSFDYAHRLADDLGSVDSKTPTGNAGSIAANRISYFLDLKGPSLVIDTACSSALVAFHQACESIRRGESSMAFAGGVSLHFHPLGFLTFTKTGMLSRGGRCRTFAENADGYVRSEGGGVVILKPMERALDEGDCILAVVEATGINCDGRTPGITVPSGEAQAALLREVYSKARIQPGDLDYLEAHGTGTAVGDPIETWAIGEVLGKARPKTKPLPIGSVKSNLGHLEAASAVAGWTKVLLMLKHRRIPPNIHFDSPNPRIDFEELNLRVVAKPEPLPKRGRLVVGINSFGFGGANAHAVFSLPAPKRKTPPTTSPCAEGPLPFVFSAKSQEALKAVAERLAGFLEAEKDASLYDVAWALKERREWLPKRAVVLESDRDALIESLRKFSQGIEISGVLECDALPDAQSPVFVFTGNGGQWDFMGRQLYTEDSVFRQAVRRVDAEFQKLARFSLLPHFEGVDLPGGVARTEIAQPLIFAIQVGLVESLAACGVRPAAVLGHSLGEIAAAWACGLLDLASAVRVIRFRSLHQESTKGLGGMTAVAVSLGDMERILEEPALDGNSVVVSGENGPASVTVAGPLGHLETLERVLASRSIQFKRLDLDYPFHSPAMDLLLMQFRRDLGETGSSTAAIPFHSTVTGEKIVGTLPEDYWSKNIREPVRFREALESASQDGHAVFLEIGPHPVLCNHVKAVFRNKKTGAHAESVVTREACGLADLDAAAWRLKVGGMPCDWKPYFPVPPGAFIELPRYPWQREDYFLPVSPEGGGMLMRFKEHPLLGYRLREAAWIWENHLDVETLPWLADHKVGGMVVYPAAAFLESALAAGALRHGSESTRVEGLEIRSPLVLPEKSSKTLRFHLEEESGRFTIQSRDRMSEDSWQPHAVGRIAPKASKIRPRPIECPFTQKGSAARIYQAAIELGLDYGPAFRALESTSGPGRTISAALATPAAIETGLEKHVIHPVFVDAAMQSLFSLFLSENGNPPDQAFLPVRFESFDVFRTKSAVATTRVEVRRHSARSLLADLQFFDSAGELLASCTGARFRSAHLTKPSFDRARAFVQTWIPRALPGPRSVFNNRHGEVVGWIRSAFDAESENGPAKRYAVEGDALLDTLCSAFALETFRNLADGAGTVSLGNAIDTRSLAPENAEYFRRLAEILERDGFFKKTGCDIWTIQTQNDLPPSQEIWRTLVADFPAKASRIGLVGGVGLHLGEILSGKKSLESCLPKWIRLSCGSSHIPGSALKLELQKILAETLQPMQGGRLLWVASPRPVEDGFPAVWMRESGCAITVLLPSGHESDEARVRLASFPNIEILRAPANGNLFGEFTAADRRFDAVVAPGHILESCAASLSQLVFEGGLVLGILPEKSRLFEFLPPLSLLAKPCSASCLSALKSAFDSVETVSLIASKGVGPSIVLAAAPVAVGSQCPRLKKSLVLPLGDDAKFEAEALAAKLDGFFEILPPLEDQASRIWGELLEREKPEVVIFVSSSQNTAQSSIESLAAITAFFKILAASLPTVEVVIVTRNAFVSAADSSWMAAGLWGFARVARNEFSQFKVRCIDWQASVAISESLETLANEISSRDTEEEVLLAPSGRMVARVSLAENSNAESDDAVLDFDSPGPFQNLKWKSRPPRKPAVGEVEIEVRAAGLNFRDVMFAMGLLPDEALEGGFAGPTLGMELSGVVVSTGPNAERFRPGDEVIAFAPASFAKRSITSVSAVMLKPPGISFEAGATIPAAFFTAWHSLVDLAGLRRGERLLIHGAAGGVGIAAIQIARWIGAEIFATAGTADKRDFVSLLGADHIYDSRSLDFAEEILAATQGEGVDVVLNSLAGEAVTKNLEILRPFGRFLELGKRDFYENNRIALRPFRNNIRYFAVDADQLMAIRPDEAAVAFEKLMGLFQKGVLTPLPYRAFEAADAAEAFRHMQHSGHTGKIVLRLENIPPVPETLAATNPSFDKNGTYLVTGGTTGFGLQTARWLVEHGAGALVLASRRGVLEGKTLEFLEEARASGIQVLAEPCDVTNAQALEMLLERVRSSMPPLRGVFHAAMVLNDSLIVNSDSSQIESVLLPKIAGAANLHKLTLRDSLDHFVVYSSATTLFGNPGQAFYVAANAALEEFAARRGAQGLPSTCIAWGPIGDTGYLSRNQQVKEALAARTGGQPLESRDALRFLGQALSASATGMAWMDLDWSALSRFLPSAGSPRFRSLSQSISSFHTSDPSPGLRRKLELMELPELIETLKGVLREEISTILRVPAAKFDENKSLLEIGMDSLMGVELMTSLENSLGITIPMMALSEAPTIAKLAERLAHSIKPTDDSRAEMEESAVSQFRALAKQHGVHEVGELEMPSIAGTLAKTEDV